MPTDLQTRTKHQDPLEVVSELRDWLRDLLGGLTTQPKDAREALLAGLSLGARQELAIHGVISSSDAHAGQGKEVLTPFGNEVMRFCAEHVEEHGASEDFREQVAEATRWAEEKSTGLRESGVIPPHERRRAKRRG